MNHESKIINCIHDKLKEQSDKKNILPRGKLITILGLIYRFPKDSRQDIINELENKGVITIISKVEVRVN
jgi:hypothetical protein